MFKIYDFTSTNATVKIIKKREAPILEPHYRRNFMFTYVIKNKFFLNSSFTQLIKNDFRNNNYATGNSPTFSLCML